MKHLLATAICATVLSWPNDATQTPISAAEQLRAAAIVARDPSIYDRVTAADLIVVDRLGHLHTKSDRLLSVIAGDGVPRAHGERDVDVRRFGDVAVVMGRSVWNDGGRDAVDYFSRIWARVEGKWRLVATHTTDVTSSVSASKFDAPARPVLPLGIDATPPGATAEDDVRRAIVEQHQAYWGKDPQRYRRYAGADLLRIAETGVRPREELIRMMRGNARLPAPPSAQEDISVRVYGNAAVTMWIDEGRDILGRPTRSRFTVVFARRSGQWQMVHIQSNGIRG